MTRGIQIRFNGDSFQKGPRFVETEDAQGRGISLGTWLKDDDGSWLLFIGTEEMRELAALIDDAGGDYISGVSL